MTAASPTVSGTHPGSETSRRPLIRPIPISITLATSIGLLVAFAVFAELAIGFWTGRKNTLDLLNEKSTMMVSTIETGVRNHLDPALDQLAFIDRQVETGVLDTGDKARMADVLVGALAAAPQIVGISFWDAELQQTIAIAEPGEALQVLNQDHRANPTIVRLAAQAREAEGPFWGELIFDDFTFVNVIQPLRRSGEFLGFLGTAVTMPELSSLMNDVGDLFQATAFILYGEDRVLAHANLMSPHPDLSEENPVVALDRVGDLVLAKLPSRRPVQGFERAAKGGVLVEELDIFDDTHVVFSREIRSYGDVPWIVGAHVPVDIVNTEFRRLMTAGLAGLAVLAIAILAALVLGQGIARPVKRLAAGASRIARLELADVPTQPTSHIRELNDQANAFNAMLSGLRWLETYVPRSLVKRLIEQGDTRELTSEERELTVMFTDIVGFTTLSETMPAAETAAFLNDHFALLGASVEAEGGTIDKFIGDALMAFWGAPDEQEDNADRACRAARAIRRAVDRDNVRRQKEGRAPVRLRIGIHTGPVVVGNIGAPGRMNYTIVGDTVNTGQRVEALGKELDTGDAV
ncbi:MAG: adenylate/guanylate cyclase domain-containing protein, partial [Alphaproteobacteria bacterium]